MRRIIGITFLLAAASAGCSHKPTVEELTQIKKGACACQDKACAEKYDEKMVSLLSGVTEDDLDEKTMSLTLDIAACTGKLGVD